MRSCSSPGLIRLLIVSLYPVEDKSNVTECPVLKILFRIYIQAAYPVEDK